MSNDSDSTVQDGKVVSFHYTLTDDDGNVLDSSSGGEPLPYLHGASNIVPGLEDEMAGKSEGDAFQVVVSPEQGYGEKQPTQPQSVPREAFPEEVDLQEGMQFAVEGPDGQFIPIWIAQVGDEEVMVDTNHPLAGQTLHFDIEVVDIRDATDEEISHGHPHGPDGHGHH